VIIGDLNGEEAALPDMLSMLGYDDILIFSSFSQSQEYMISHNIDLVFLDADDEFNLWEIQLGEIREVKDYIRIVLVSKDGKAALKAYERGVWDYLLKPIKKKQLERLLSNAT
jgi:two-component SAPR family response regulator